MKIENSFFEKHELLRQLVTFAGVSFLSMITEMSTYFFTKYLLVNVLHITKNANWFVFQNYSEEKGGLGLLVAFLISTFLAQVVAFILNRKKTFRSDCNIVKAATAYFFMVLIILFVSAAICGSVYTFSYNLLIKSCSTGKSDLVSGIISKLASGAVSGSVTFVISKFVIMTNQVK